MMTKLLLVVAIAAAAYLFYLRGGSTPVSFSNSGRCGTNTIYYADGNSVVTNPCTSSAMEEMYGTGSKQGPYVAPPDRQVPHVSPLESSSSLMDLVRQNWLLILWGVGAPVAWMLLRRRRR